MNGPFDSIPYDDSYSTMIDWEAELAVVIGKRVKIFQKKTPWITSLAMLPIMTLQLVMFSKNGILANGLKGRVWTDMANGAMDCDSGWR